MGPPKKKGTDLESGAALDPFRKTRIEYAARTDRGRERDGNEDAFLSLPEQGLFAVADGMGGHNAGEVASRMALETLADKASGLAAASNRASWFKRLFRREKVRFNPVEWLHQTISEANHKIHRSASGDQNRQGMGTTLALILKQEDALLTAHVGDSRVYRWRKRRISQLTQDHSLAQELVRQGVMSENEALYSAPSHVLTRALGVRGDVQEDIIYHSVEEGDVFLLCSDGLHNMVDDPDIEKILNDDGLSVKDKAGRLVDAANEAGGTDNITVVLARFS
jgi:protein phosphatase